MKPWSDLSELCWVSYGVHILWSLQLIVVVLLAAPATVRHLVGIFPLPCLCLHPHLPAWLINPLVFQKNLFLPFCFSQREQKGHLWNSHPSLEQIRDWNEFRGLLSLDCWFRASNQLSCKCSEVKGWRVKLLLYLFMSWDINTRIKKNVHSLCLFILKMSDGCFLSRPPPPPLKISLVLWALWKLLQKFQGVVS